MTSNLSRLGAAISLTRTQRPRVRLVHSRQLAQLGQRVGDPAFQDVEIGDAVAVGIQPEYHLIVIAHDRDADGMEGEDRDERKDVAQGAPSAYSVAGAPRTLVIVTLNSRGV